MKDSDLNVIMNWFDKFGKANWVGKVKLLGYVAAFIAVFAFFLAVEGL